MYVILLAAMLMFAPAVAHATSHDMTKLPFVAGEVRKVDRETGKLTLKHAPIPNLDMPDMTMVFRVKDPAMLDKVKVGDQVRFTADKVNGVFTVTNVEVVK